MRRNAAAVAVDYVVAEIDRAVEVRCRGNVKGAIAIVGHGTIGGVQRVHAQYVTIVITEASQQRCGVDGVGLASSLPSARVAVAVPVGALLAAEVVVKFNVVASAMPA